MYHKLILFIGLILLSFLLIGCQKSEVTENIPISKNDELIIEKYLKEKVMDSNFEGDIFTAYEILETDKGANEVYLWALIQVYFKKGESIEESGGMSVPIVLNVSESNGSLEILNHSLPRDGSYYPTDIKEMFPNNIQDKIFDYGSTHIDELIKEIKHKVNESY